MQKYVVCMMIEVKKELFYKKNMIGLWMSALFGILIQVKLWEAIYHDSPSSGTIPFQRLYMYFICGMIYMHFLNGGISRIVSDQIRSGQIAVELLRPQSYFLKLLFGDLGRGVVHAVSITLLAILFSLFHRQYVTGAPAPVLLCAALSAVLGYILNVLLEYCVGLAGVWFGVSIGLEMMKTSLFSFLGGVFIPLDFYPQWLQNVIGFFPFKYIYYVPVSHCLASNGRISVWMMGMQLGWVLLFLVFAVWLRKKADKKMTVQGG